MTIYLNLATAALLQCQLIRHSRHLGLIGAQTFCPNHERIIEIPPVFLR